MKTPPQNQYIELCSLRERKATSSDIEFAKVKKVRLHSFQVLSEGGRLEVVSEDKYRQATSQEGEQGQTAFYSHEYKSPI